jgi:hypothetical protein
MFDTVSGFGYPGLSRQQGPIRAFTARSAVPTLARFQPTDIALSHEAQLSSSRPCEHAGDKAFGADHQAGRSARKHSALRDCTQCLSMMAGEALAGSGKF